MDNIQNNKSNDVFMQPCNFCIHCLLSFFRQDAISIVCCACVQASSVQETCFVNNFIIQMCFSTASHNYGNQSLGQTGTIIRQEEIFFFSNIFLQKKSTCDFWQYEGSLPSQWKASRLLEKNKNNKKNYRQSAHKQTSTTSHHLQYQLLVMQTLCGVQWAVGYLRRQLGFHSLLLYC